MEEAIRDQQSVISKEEKEKKPSPADRRPLAAANSPESGGRGGLEPTRYGDWEIKGKCVDF